MIKQGLVILILLVFSRIPASLSQSVTASVIQSYLLSMDTLPEFRTINWGCSFERSSDGKNIAGIHSEKMLVPASVIKLAVTYPALRILTPDFRFSTTIEYDGAIKDSILHGSIYIRGGGDPTLGSWRFSTTVADTVFYKVMLMIKRAGIKEIEGGLIAESDYFAGDIIPGTWLWEDIGNYYGGGISGLNFHENQMEVVFQPGSAIGEAARIIRIEPPVEGLVSDNEVTTAAENTGDRVVIFGAPYDDHRIFTGTVPLGVKEFTVKGSLPDPSITLVKQLHNYLTINDLTIKFGPITTKILHKQGNRISRSRTILGKIESPELIDIIKLTHEKSINLYTDALLKMMGRVQGGEGSYDGGIRSVLAFWKKQKVDTETIILKDGCGLSLANSISAATMARLISIISRDTNNDTFLQSLNLAGESGDLKSLFPDGSCFGQLYGKSGYMRTVRAYTGIINDSRPGKAMSFSVIVNHSGKDNAVIKAEIKKLLELLCRYED